MPFLSSAESRCRLAHFAAALAAFSFSIHLRAQSLPTGAQIVAGQVNISAAGNQMALRQTTPNAIVNWQSFNIGAGAAVNINQPGSGAAMLARVVGNDPSQLLGSLTANGSLFLINRRGIIVGKDAVIETGAFVGSTLDISDAEFLRGAGVTFKGDSDAGIVNLGTIRAQEGGVFLFAHTVQNAGGIAAPHGTAGLGAGTEVFLASADSSAFVIKTNLKTTTAKIGVDNSGVVAAAQAQLEAAGGSIYDLAINQTGVVRATGVENRNGRILLTADGGTVGVSGTAVARNANGSGGEILVGGGAHGDDPAVANASHTVVTSTALLDASAGNADTSGGRVIVWADEATRFLGHLDAHGAGGGFAEVSGRHGLEFNPAAAANLGPGGTLLLDPDALVISSSANSGTSTSGTNPFTFGATTTPATLNVTTLQNQLATSNVILDTSTAAGDITFNAAVTWSTANSLTAKAGGSINLNQNITASNASSALVLNPGKAATPTQQGLNPLNPKATLASSATITVGTLTYGTNGSAAPVNYTTTGGASSADFQGTLSVGTLQVDLSNGGAGVGATGANNTIGTFKTIGTGDLTFANVANNHGALSVQLTTANASAPQVRITTPGILTLLAGTSVTFANPTDVILASTGAGFINQAGSGAFGNNARFLIYASSGGATTKGGLTGIDVYSHPYNASDDFSGDFNSRFLFTAGSGLPFLTYTADNKSRTYGAGDPTFTATVTGVLSGITNDVTGSPTFSTTATQSSGVGSYTINVGRGTLASSNYDFTFASGTLSITAAPLTITANNASRTPNTANPTFGVSYSGLVNGDTSSVVSGLTIGTTATLSSAVGTYPITPSGATAANYSISFVPGTLTITNTAPLTITANSFTRTYGSANPSFTAAISGLVGTDTTAVVSGLQFSTAATQSSGVGTYAITPFGATAPGYVISYIAGTLTIDRASLLISPQNASRLYGDANPTLTASFNGLANGDTAAAISGLTFNTTATTASNVGAYPISVSGGSNPNYNISYGPNAQLTVTPAPLTVKFDDKTRVYGDANPALTYSVGGLKNGDTAASAVSVSDIHTTATPTDGLGAYGINGLVLPQSSNYSATGVGGDLTITPRPLTITADNKTKVYGDPNPALTATFTGLASFDSASVIPNVQLTTTATQASGVSDLGYGILVTSDLNRNYAISYKFGTLAITPASLSLLAPPDVSRLYGRADPTLPPLNFGGLKNSDTVAGLRASYINIPAPTADVGTYNYGVAIDNPNYKLSGATTGTFRVDPAPLDVRIDGYGRLYGDANPASYNFTATGLAFGQTAGSVLQVSNPADQTAPVGIYQLQAKPTSKNYYVNSTTGGAFQINPRSVSLTIDNVAKYYGDVGLPDFHATVGGDGLAPFDNTTALFTAFLPATPVTASSDAGLYRIDPVLTTNPNYRVQISSGYLAILPRPVEVAVRNAVTFGNDQIPDGFDAAALGLDLITGFNRGGVGQGYSVVVTGLPPNTTVAQAFPTLSYTLSDTNTPSPVGTVVTDPNTVFPARPGLSAAITPGAALPPLPPATVTLSPSALKTPDIAPPLDPSSVKIGDKTIADGISYIVPKIGGRNYVITKITNGILTSKPDPTVLQSLKDIQAFKDIVAAANKAFYWTDETDKTKKGAFGFTSDMFPFLRDLLLQMLESGDEELLAEVFGAKADEWNSLSSFYREGYMSIWLSDLHNNPAKQAKMLPYLVNFAMLAAAQPPDKNSADQKKVLEAVKPYLAAAEKSFATKLEQEKETWKQQQNSAKGAGDFMLGTDEFEEVMGNAMGDLSKSTMDSISGSIESMAEKGALIGGSGGVAGTAVGAAAVKNLAALNSSSLDDLSTLLSNYGQLSDNVVERIRFKAGDIVNTPEGKAAIEAAGQKAADEFKYTLTDADKAKVSSMITGKAQMTDEELRAALTASQKAQKEFLDANKQVLTDAFKEGYGKAFLEASKTMSKDEAIAVANQAGAAAKSKALGALQDQAKALGAKAYASTEESLLTERFGKDLVESYKEKAVQEAEDAVKTKLKDQMADELTAKFTKALSDDAGTGETSAYKLADKFSSEILQDADTVVKKATGQIADSGANTAEKALTVGNNLLEKAGDTAASKAGAKIAGQLLETASEEVATKVAVKVGTAAAKVASFAKAAFFGPAALVELAVDLAVTAATNGIARGEEEKQLNKVIADCAAGKNSNDPHAMMQDGLGQGILMMAFVQMMTPASTTTTATAVAAAPTPSS